MKCPNCQKELKWIKKESFDCKDCRLSIIAEGIPLKPSIITYYLEEKEKSYYLDVDLLCQEITLGEQKVNKFKRIMPEQYSDPILQMKYTPLPQKVSEAQSFLSKALKNLIFI